MSIYYWQTEKDRAWAWEGQREETQNMKQAPGFALSAQSTDAGLELTDVEIMTWAEVGRLTEDRKSVV